MAQANRITKVTLPVLPAPVAPVAVTKAPSYVAPALVASAAPAQSATQAAIKFLQQSLGVAPQAPVAPSATLAPMLAPAVVAGRVSLRTMQTWARSVPAANKASVLIPKVHANFAPHQTVTVLVANPKAAGKGPATRFALYGGQGATLTVAAYLAKCAKANIPMAVTHADLMWDFNHGYISVA